MSSTSEPDRERRRLTDLAYRFLGSSAEAEDAVQETYARWYALSDQQRDAIDSPPAWLTTVASRICLNVLGSARARRERYVGEWVPEPLPDRTAGIGGRPADAIDPADRVTLDESVTLAFLVARLDPGATAVADGGGLASAELHPLVGGKRIAAALLDLTGRAPDVTPVERTVNGQPGLVAERDGTILTVYAFHIADYRIARIRAVRNPEKLRGWTASS